jgi:hypothetical protein
MEEKIAAPAGNRNPIVQSMANRQNKNMTFETDQWCKRMASKLVGM